MCVHGDALWIAAVTKNAKLREVSEELDLLFQPNTPKGADIK